MLLAKVQGLRAQFNREDQIKNLLVHKMHSCFADGDGEGRALPDQFKL